MSKQKFLLDEFGECDSFVLIAIHCTLEDYRLVYLMNQKLNLRLRRLEKDIDYSEANYSIFEWKDPKELINWNVVSNFCSIETESENNNSTLFKNQARIRKSYYLIPEYETANYLLKITNHPESFNQKSIIEKLLEIPQIVLAYEIETEILKSKTNLIFN